MQYIFIKKGDENVEKERKYKSYLRFSEIIEEKKITPYRVAIDTGISPMVLSDWKNDKSKPKLDKMVRIAEYLGVDVVEFVE